MSAIRAIFPSNDLLTMIKEELNTKLRSILSDNKCYNPATIFNPLSVRIASEVGFSLGIIPGKIVALDYLAEPDLMLLTLSELTDTVRRIAKSSKIPLIVDADHGYGNALNVHRTVECLEDAGASGISIEDTDLPLKFGLNTGEQCFITLKEAAMKIKIAVDTKNIKSTCIIARIGSYQQKGIDDILERAQAYVDSGADALFFINVNSRSDIERIVKSNKVPIILGNNSTEITLSELTEMGVSISLPGHISYYNAIEEYRKTIKSLIDTGNYEQSNIDMDDIGNLSNEKKYVSFIKKYMKE